VSAGDNSAAAELQAELAQFTGAQEWFRHPLFRGYLYTEGVQYLAEKAQAYWLIDVVFSHQTTPRVRREPFQVWRLMRTRQGRGAVVTAEDGNGKIIARQVIEYTDFPLPNVTLFLEEKTLLLPSEH
jgi:hypothetical protein